MRRKAWDLPWECEVARKKERCNESVGCPMAIRFFDMFAGIGGFRSGLTAVGGYACVGHCEIDPYANQAYNAIYEPKGERYFEDARTIDPGGLPDLDLITAGFPCQSFSISGKRLGFADDTRGTLFFEIARIAEAKRPPFLLLENVPGLLSHDAGRTFAAILSTLAELGYGVEWCVHNSADFGVPQQRRRLYLVGSLGGYGTGWVFPLGCGGAQNLKELIPGPQGQRVYDPKGVSCTLCAGAGGWGGRTGLSFIDLNPDPQVTDEARCITARQDSGVTSRRGEHSAVLLEDAPGEALTPDKPVLTITAQDRHGVWHRGRIRKLMPVECWRLQGFTDEQFYRAQAAGLADSRLYAMAGNAVSVPVISAIGQKIKEINDHYHMVE